MAKIVFLDIDTQFDFMDPKGALYVQGAELLVPNMVRLLGVARARNIPVLSTMDTHSGNDPEFEKFPPHCVENTSGQEKLKETTMKKVRKVSNAKQDVNPMGWEQVVIEKSTLNVFGNVNTDKILKSLKAKRFVVFGVATDYCVFIAAKGLLERGYKVDIVTDAIAAVDNEAGNNALKELEEKGARLLTTEKILQNL